MGRTGKERKLACPHCGALFRAGRLSCPACGSDRETGWKTQEEIDYEAVELPEEETLYPPPRRQGGWFRKFLVPVVVAALVFLLTGLGWCVYS